MRNNVIDAIKGFAILLVIIGHLMQKSLADFDHNIIWRFIYSFHMPLFFFVSGFLAFFTKKSQIDLVFNRFKSLIVPFFVWAVVYYFFREQSKQTFYYYMKNVIVTPDLGLWFLWVLFFCYVLLVFIKSLSIKSYLGFLVVIVALFASTILIKENFFGINLISKQFPFFFLGFITNQYNEIIFEKINKFKFVVLTSFVLSALFWMRKDDPLFYKYLNLGSLFKMGYIIFVGVLGIFTTFICFFSIKVDSPNILLSSLTFIGKHTLAIYSIHFILLDWISLSNISDSLYIYILIFYTLIVAILCIMIEYVMSINSIVSNLFFGK